MRVGCRIIVFCRSGLILTFTRISGFVAKSLNVSETIPTISYVPTSPRRVRQRRSRRVNAGGMCQHICPLRGVQRAEARDFIARIHVEHTSMLTEYATPCRMRGDVGGTGTVRHRRYNSWSGRSDSGISSLSNSTPGDCRRISPVSMSTATCTVWPRATRSSS